MVASLNMKESKKSKEKNELKQLEALEQSIKIQDQHKVQKLIKEIGVDNIDIQKYLAAINSKVSFNISIENDAEEE